MNRLAIRCMTTATLIVVAAQSGAEGPRHGPPARQHTATEARPLELVPAQERAGSSIVAMTVTDDVRTIVSNGIPDHRVGRFPNAGNPNAIRAQNHRFRMPLHPQKAASPTPLQGYVFGVATNGVPIDPFAAEWWQGERRSVWNYDALGGAVPLGLDANHAHVQPDGSYHYHGLPIGLLKQIAWSPDVHSPLIGWAADGFPIYAIVGRVDGQTRPLTSSYRLIAGDRPGGDEPDGLHDGAFRADYEFVEGLGELDECNGAVTISADYPAGTYAYFITEGFPVIPACFTGTPDPSFRHGPPSGNRRGPPPPRRSGQG